ncbi:MAG TPA: citrate/2-methylcitrate synthase [Verrucomicrobiae bacterium]|nr:citrate/2-methylcitrate synthase [Verrucomicrobiae bacterium]
MPTETKPNYSPGLEGVIAGETSICWVDPNAGLLYRGYDVHDLASHASFEEVVWLLLHGELPTMPELAGISRQLASERALPAKVIEMLQLIPRDTHPMDVLRTGVSMLAAFDPELNDHSHAANIRKALRLIPKISTLVTDCSRIQQGMDLLPPKADLPMAANFLYQLKGASPEVWEAKMFDSILVLYAEHEFNASTFSARVTASTMADMYAAVTTALGTLKGPLHGGANEETMKMLEEIGSPDRAESWLKEKLARKEKIMGFGHRVYKSGDSRVPMMRELARDLGRRFGKEAWVQICEKLEAVMEREKHLCANLDLYAAPVFLLLGIPAELNTPIFAISRISGWCAHVIEQHDRNRLIRPRSLYTGKAERRYQARRDA